MFKLPKAFFLILILTIITRFYQLGYLPRAFAADEAALGYSGWSILTTGKDEWGKFLPLVLRSFDDNKPAVYSYLTIPGIILFGVNPMTARLPAAFFGVLLSVFVYLLINKLFKNKSLALLSMLMIALSPWHIEISRTAIEAGVALSLSILSIFLFLQNNSKKQNWGFVIFILALFTYHTARIVLPVIILSALFFKVIKLKKNLKNILIALSFVGLALALTQSSDRFKQISVFSDLGAKLIREESIAEDGVWGNSITMTRAMHNKPLSWVMSFTDSYLKNTSLSFLFLGGAQPPRVTIPETGQFLVLLLPFFILGLSVSVKNFKNLDKWLLFWLLIAPVPASLTTAELPHTYRTLFMLPVIAFFIGQGILFFINLFKNYKSLKILLISVLIIGLSYNFSKSWHQYQVHQQLHQPWYRQYGYKDLINYLNGLENAEKIKITNREGEPYIFVLFYNQIEPKVFHAWPQKRLAHKDIDQGIREWQMWNYEFSEESCVHNPDDSNSNNYYVSIFTCDVPKGYERVKTINFMDGNPEFVIDRPVAN
jgi:4-amino-4-deoxy-L-arabinose transferase-like glycosyltransferase